MKEYLPDIGFGLVIRIDGICNKCSSVCKPAVGTVSMYICKKCSSLTSDVKLQRVRAMATVTA